MPFSAACAYNLGIIESGTTGVDPTTATACRRCRVCCRIGLNDRWTGVRKPQPEGIPSDAARCAGGDRWISVSGRHHVFLSQSIYSGELKNRYHAGQAAERASSLSDRDARDVVVFTVGAAYCQIVAATSRLESVQAQLDSAVEIDRQATDRVAAELAPEIDALRSHVERRTAEQRVVDARTDLDKDKLLLARA